MKKILICMDVDGHSQRRFLMGVAEVARANANWTVLFDLEDRELGGFDEFADRVREMTARLHPLRLYLLDAAKYAADGEEEE